MQFINNSVGYWLILDSSVEVPNGTSVTITPGPAVTISSTTSDTVISPTVVAQSLTSSSIVNLNLGTLDAITKAVTPTGFAAIPVDGGSSTPAATALVSLWYGVTMDRTGASGLLYHGTFPLTQLPTTPAGTYYNDNLQATWTTDKDVQAPLPIGFTNKPSDTTFARFKPQWYTIAASCDAGPSSSIWTPFGITFFTLFLAALIVIIVGAAVRT
jgi:hypothetical protein